MLQVILLTTVSISTLLNVSKEDKRLWFGHSPGLVFFSSSLLLLPHLAEAFSLLSAASVTQMPKCLSLGCSFAGYN